MRHCFVGLPDHEIHLTAWGDAASPTILLMHGLARSCRDHDEIAAALASRYHVLAVDMIGRGASTWAKHSDDYGWHTYLPIVSALLDQLAVQRCAWIGTSMGGALGIATAADPQLAPRIAALVLNDMGPEVPDAAFDAILSYAGTPPVFDRVSEYEDFLRRTYVGRGEIADSTWRRLSLYGHRRCDDGRITVHNDPRVIEQIRSRRSDYQQWAAYDGLRLPTLCLRGALSKLLLPETAAAMALRGPRPQVVEIPGCGHAPGLDTPDQIGLIEGFLADCLAPTGGWA